MGGEAYIHTRMVALALAAGCVDAGAFLGLDAVFVANQTGNTVLLGLAVSRGDWEQVGRVGDSLGMFCLGVLLAAVLLRGQPEGWPRRMTVVVILEVALLAALYLLWGPLPGTVLIGLAGLAMGIQSAVTQHAGVPGVTTTFVTGNLTRVFSAIGSGQRDSVERTAGLSWLAYLLGAMAGGLVERAAGARTTMLVAAVLLAVVALIAWLPAAPRSRRTR